MQLTESDQETIKQWIESRVGASVRCFICGRNQWSLSSGSLVVGYDVHTGRIHYMDGIPMVGLICNNCGHVVWFSALMMGLQPEPAEVELPQAEKQSAQGALADASPKSPSKAKSVKPEP